MAITVINSPLDVVIITFGTICVAVQLWVWKTRIQRPATTNRKFSAVLDRIGSLFPLLGILGTVWGLIRTMGFIAESGMDDIAGTIGTFGVAMSSTFWGIIMAVAIQVFGMVLDAAIGPFELHDSGGTSGAESA